MEIGDPAEFGFDPARLQRLDRHLTDRYLVSGRLPHAQLLLARHGQPIHFSSLGQARETGAPLREDAIFRIASMTKPVTSIAYMMLLEEGLTALDDPVAEVIPEFRALRTYVGGGGRTPFVTRASGPMRMIDLLRHTSGLTYGFQHRTNVDAAYRERRLDALDGGYSNDGFVQALAEMPLQFDPGTAWNYSVSTDVLGVAVARISGMSLGDFFRRRIFEPLGMMDTAFNCPQGEIYRVPDAYARHPSGRLVLNDPGQESAWRTAPSFESGGGGLLSTTRDYHRFCNMLVNGGELGGVRIVSPKTLQLMTANHLPGGADLTQLSRSLFSESSNAGVGFGLGFAVNLDPARNLLPGTAGEYYWGGMYSTAFFIDPLNRISMVFMTQLMPSSSYPIRRELKTLIYSALIDPAG